MIKSFRTAVAALALISATSASAISLDLGSVAGDTATFTRDEFRPNRSFLDVINFRAAPSPEFSLTFLGITLTNVSLLLTDPSGATIAPSSSSVIGGITNIQFSETSVTPGSYALQVAGRPTTEMSFYTMAVTAVPEPGTWMMIAAGVVLLAFIARRRAG